MRATTLLESFRFAFQGIGYALRTQRNMRIHGTIACLVVVAGLWLGLSRWEWATIALTIGFVFLAEMMNTAVEALVDLASPNLHPLARIAKDTAAGGVVLAALTSVIIGLLILGPHLMEIRR